MRVVRWRGLGPLLVFMIVVVGLWILFLDTLVRRGVEAVGTDLVGAKVELAEADVRLHDGFVALRGLQVANPDAPMHNLVEAREIVADIRITALTQKKIFIDTVAIRGVRFGTERASSGAVDNPSSTSRALRRRVDAWADGIRIPAFSLEGLTGVVDVDAIRPESLQTIGRARGLVTEVDSARTEWLSRLQQLNPAPAIDSAEALVDRLSGASLASLGVTGMVQTVRSARSTLDELTGLQQRFAGLEQGVRSGLSRLQSDVTALADARDRDLAYARGLLNIPSLDAPDLSPSLFGELAVRRLQPVLYWIGLAERYVPPGLDPRRRPGAQRARRRGTTVDFPTARSFPKFTLAFGEASLDIGGDGVAAGAYQAEIRGLTSAPAALGQPLRLRAARTAGTTGPSDVRLDLLVDHVAPPLRDSMGFAASGVTLPFLSLPGVGAQLDLGQGSTQLSFQRTGDSLVGRWLWRSSEVRWERPGPTTASGIQGRIEELLWNTISSLENVEIETRFSGRVSSPRLAIRSNIGTALARSLRQELRGQIAAAETQVRAEVERLVAPRVADAAAGLAAAQHEVGDVVAGQRSRLDRVRADLEKRIADLTRFLPPGVGIPE